jgi:predicted amidohydrolase YtcJ
MKIFHNAHIYSPENPDATAFVVNQGCFLALGTDDEVMDSFPKAELSVNLEGRTVWPGLTDSHVHLRHLAESMSIVDCETDTLKECLSRIKAAAEKLPENAWVRGHGWNQNLWKEGFGTAEQLDSICGGRPAYLTAKSLHAAWVNSKALELAGINAQTPDPTSGMIQRDEKGHPTGILFESQALAMIESSIPKPSQEELTAKLEALLPELWKLGLIGIHDFDGFECWQALQILHNEGRLQLRVRKNILHEHMDAFIHAGLRTDDGSDLLHMGGVKLFSDGALGPQTGAMIQPYEQTEEVGLLLMTEEEILAIGKQAVNHGLALTIHAIGDLANHVVLNAYEKLRVYESDHDLPHLQHRIEHVQVIDPDDLPRLAALDIIASVQPIHATSDMVIADKYLGDRSRNAYAFNTLQESGATLIFGSDAPVESVNPFYGIHAAVTRRRLDGSPGPDGWHPEQRLALEDALAGFSRTPAEVANRGMRLGKIADGYRADFLILNEDPFGMEPQALGHILPEATFIDGRCVYKSPDLAVDI